MSTNTNASDVRTPFGECTFHSVRIYIHHFGQIIGTPSRNQTQLSRTLAAHFHSATCTGQYCERRNVQWWGRLLNTHIHFSHLYFPQELSMQNAYIALLLEYALAIACVYVCACSVCETSHAHSIHKFGAIIKSIEYSGHELIHVWKEKNVK